MPYFGRKSPGASMAGSDPPRQAGSPAALALKTMTPTSHELLESSTAIDSFVVQQECPSLPNCPDPIQQPAP
jgi:hypothetical protein